MLHLGAEKLRDPAFRLSAWVASHKPRIVAFALHWHPQTYDTLAAAAAVKQANPEVQVVLGGLTATAFADELVEQHPYVDVVVRGEAEVPLRRLVAGEPLESIPNLTWRDAGGMTRTSSERWLSTGTDLSAWSFSRFDLVEQARTVLAFNWRLSWEPEYERKRLGTPTLFGMSLGRGCLGTCTWCAGSFTTTRTATGRRRSAWRNGEAVAHTIEAARAHGVERFYTCFDPHPHDPDTLLGIFDVLGELEPKVSLDFEAFGLPGTRVLEAFGQQLAPDSTMILSPETADEELRKRHRAFHFSNAELDEVLRRCDSLDLAVWLYFIVGLPGETRAGVLATADLIDSLAARFTAVRQTYVHPLEMEPNSPWFNEPERYGLRLRHRTLEDFRRAHGEPEMSLGYDSAHLTEAEVFRLYDELFLPIPAEARQQLLEHWAAHTRDYHAVRDH